MKHPLLHLGYWLGIVVFVLICVLAVEWSAIPGLPEVISLALSLSSLVLAVIAILQSLTSQNALSDAASQIRNSAAAAEAAARSALSATDLLKQEVSEIPSALSTVSEKLDQHTAVVEALSNNSKAQPVIRKDDTKQLLSNMSFGLACLTLACALSAKHKKPFDLTDTVLVGSLSDMYKGMILGLRAMAIFELTRVEATVDRWTCKAVPTSPTVELMTGRMRYYVGSTVSVDDVNERVRQIFSYFSSDEPPTIVVSPTT